MPFVSVYLNWLFFLYTIVVGFFLAGHGDGLHIQKLMLDRFLPGWPYHILMAPLVLGFFWMLFADKLVRPAKEYWQQWQTTQDSAS
jgi:hypothetical protein